MQSLPEPSSDQLARWRSEQVKVAARIVESDQFSWSLEDDTLYVAGVDVSFSVHDERDAIATATVIELRPRNKQMRAVYSTSARVMVGVPYAAGYLAFRELHLALRVLRALPKRPDALLVDGNGVLHHRAAGLACQLGLALDLPTIGVGKNLLCVDGLDERDIRQQVAKAKDSQSQLVGSSGRVWGCAMLTGNAAAKPIFVSVGHRISLMTATKLVHALCKFRVPEPVRLADIHSREALRSGRLVQICAPDYSSQDE